MVRRLVPETGLFLPTYRDRHGVLAHSNIWWFRITIGGKKLRVCTRLRDLRSANEWAIQQKAAFGRGNTLALTSDRVDLKALCGMLETDYSANKRRTLKKVQARTKMLLDRLGNPPALSVTTDRLTAMVAELQREGYADGTINLVLAALKRAFFLAIYARRLSRDALPYIPMLTLRNARKGFFEPDELDLILAQMAPEHRPVVRVAYITGWRVESELLTRQWRHVDFDAGWLRLDPEETKNRQGRMFPVIPSLRAALEDQRAITRALETRRGCVIPWVFHRHTGARWRSLQYVWQEARKAAGFPSRLMHDMRRTAARNLIRAGLSEGWAMSYTGHQTASVFRRYAIIDEGMLREGGAKLEAVLSKTTTGKIARLQNSP